MSGRYDVAWKDLSRGQYGVWGTDSNGNYISNLTNGAVSGNSTILESLLLTPILAAILVVATRRPIRLA